MNEKIRRGEIYIADLRPVVGSEQDGVRPVLILQNDIGNMFSPTTIVAPLTSQVSRKHRLPTHVETGEVDGLPSDSVVLLEQIRVLDKSRLMSLVSTLRGSCIMEGIDRALEVSLDLDRRVRR